MRRTPFNDGWSLRPQAVDRFAEMMDPGVGLTPVTLPHDAVTGIERSDPQAVQVEARPPTSGS